MAARKPTTLCRDSQQLGCVLAQDCPLIGGAQAGCADDVLHGRGGPGKEIIGPDHIDQVPKRLRTEDQRVDIDLLTQILGWVFLERLRVTAGSRRATVIGAIGVS